MPNIIKLIHITYIGFHYTVVSFINGGLGKMLIDQTICYCIQSDPTTFFFFLAC